MRLSGTYMDRLVYLFIPISCLAAVILWICALDTEIIVKAPIILALISWSIDTLYLFINYKNPQRLILEGQAIRYGNNSIAFSEIKSMEIMTGFCLRWTYRMIKIELFDSKPIYSLAKPLSIIDWIQGRRQTKSEELIRSVPELKDKLMTENRVTKKTN